MRMSSRTTRWKPLPAMSAPVPISCLPAGHSTVTLLVVAESLALKLVTRCRPGTAADAMLASAPPTTTKTASSVAARRASRLSGRCGMWELRCTSDVLRLMGKRQLNVDPARRALAPRHGHNGSGEGSKGHGGGAADVFQALNAQRRPPEG